VTFVSEGDDVFAEFRFRVADFAEERFIAGEETAVQQTHSEFGVGGIDEIALGGNVNGLADAQAFVPEIAKEGGEGLFDFRLGFFVRDEDEEIDIGMGEKLTTSITTDGCEGDTGGHELPVAENEPVDKGRTRGDSASGVARGEEMFPDPLFGYQVIL
jgi:hypothetical protein